MATVIDALLVTLGLNASNFTQGSANAGKSVNTLTQQTKTLGSIADAATEKFAHGISHIRLQLLSLYSVVSAGRGFKQMIGDIIQSDYHLGQFANSIGDTTERISQWSNVVSRAGGTAEGFAGTMRSITHALAQSRQQGFSDQLLQFQRLGIDVVDPRTRRQLSVEQILMNTRRTLQQRHIARVDAEEWFSGTIDSGTMAALYTPDAQFNQYVNDQKRIGNPNDADAQRAQKIINALDNTKQILEQLVRGLVREFGDDIIKGLKALNEWMLAHKEDIVKFFKSWEKSVKEFDWQGLITHLEGFATAVDSIVKSMGGWLRVTEILLGLWAVNRVAGLFAGVVNLARVLAPAGGGALAGGGGAGGAATAAGGALRGALRGVGLAGGAAYLAGQAGDWLAQHGTPAGQEFANRPQIARWRNLLTGRWTSADGGTPFSPGGTFGPQSGPPVAPTQTPAATGPQYGPPWPPPNILDRVRIDGAYRAAMTGDDRWHRLTGGGDNFPTYEPDNSGLQQNQILDVLRRGTQASVALLQRFEEWTRKLEENSGLSLQQGINNTGINLGGPPMADGSGPPTNLGGKVNPSQAARQSFAWWVNRGMTPAAAAGIVANEMAESGGDPNAAGDKVNGVATARGLYQWHKPRRDRILRATGIDVWNASADQQREAFYLEGQLGLDPQWGSGFRHLSGITDPRQAGSIVSLTGERPGLTAAQQLAEAVRRGNDAAGYNTLYASGHQAGPAQTFYGPQSLRMNNTPAAVDAGAGDSSTAINFGDINVFTNQKDGNGIGRDIRSSLSRTLATQANTGLR